MHWLPPLGDRAPTELSADAARVAGGGSIVFAGGIIDRALRWCTKFVLARVLGPAGLGILQAAVSVVTVVTAFSPLGLDTGVVYFGARYTQSGDKERLKGTVLAGFLLSVFIGALAAIGLWAAAAYGPWWAADSALQLALQGLAPAVAIWTPLLFCVGSLRAVKDMKRSALAYQVGFPSALLATVLVAVGVLGMGIPGAILAYLVALTVGLLLAVFFAWKRHGHLFRDATVKARLEIGKLLGFSLPQSLTAAAFRLNLQMDVLMLVWLAGAEEVGLYAVAASLAMIGELPANAITSIFNPFISELVEAKNTERLNALLKTVTRWLVIGAFPVYLGIALLADAILALYGPAYTASAVPLLVLIAGQSVAVFCAPAMRLIPMSGHTMLNLVNGVVALLLNITLNYLLIPEYGAVGAAMATGVTVAAWALWRLVEVWHLLRCFPFSLRTLALLAGGGVLTAAAFSIAGDAFLGRALVWVGASALWLALAATVGRRPVDAEVWSRVRGRKAR